MCTRRGFTLRDLIVTLVVLVLLALALDIFRPWARSGELARRAGCAINLSNMGKAIALYRNANNDRFPFIDGPAAWDKTPTGTNRTTGPKADTPHAVTAMMFLLLRDGDQSAKMFKCYSDANVTEDANLKDATGKYCWDFSSAKNCSYGYQLPLANNSTGIFSVDPKLTGKAKDEAEAKDRLTGSVIIMADKAPAGDLGGYAAGDKANAYMSPNHNGDFINALRADASVMNSRTPDIGVNKDYIYTASGKKDGGSQYGGTASQAKHLSELDSCIVGPK